MSAADRRPAMLIAIGSFGRAVAKKLLVEAALRGRLSWLAGEDHGGERWVAGLGVLWLPEGEAPAELEVADGSAGLELMHDLDRQIERVEPAAGESALAEAAVTLAKRLLAARARGELAAAPPLGLDVVVVARPVKAEAIGWLERVLPPALDRLAAMFPPRPASATQLAFLQILDFENFWSADGAEVRAGLKASAIRWRERALAGRPAFGRIYLVDGRTRDGFKSGKDRLEEIALFLDLLLLEEVRGAGDLHRLFGRRQDGEWPLATFGVRAFERSSQLTSRLAAAFFALGWLAHLDHGSTGPGGADPRPAVETWLDEIADTKIHARLGLPAVDQGIDHAFSALEKELEQVAPNSPDWPARIAESLQKGTAAAEARLEAELDRALALHGRWLDELPEKIAAALDRDFEDPICPASLATALTRLERRRVPAVAAISPRAEGEASAAQELADLAGLHGRFEAFLEEAVDLARLRGFWLLWAAAFSLVGAPLLLEALRTVPAPAAASHTFFQAAFRLFDSLRHPAAVASVLTLALGAFGFFVIHGRLVRALERGRRFFLDPLKGRFPAALRRALGRGGGLRRPLERRLESVFGNVAESLRGRLAREIELLGERLRERRRELSWLKEQLAELLRVHGLEDERSTVPAIRPSSVLVSAGREKDLAERLLTNPAAEGRFRSLQVSERPFLGWQETYGGLFLRPLEFLDRLSRSFAEPEPGSAGSPDSAAGETPWVRGLADFLQRHRRFDLAFSWPREGAPIEELICLGPLSWQRLLGVQARLREIGVADERTLVLGESRLYLLRLQLGVEPSQLDGVQP